jgi:ABC-type xylose transport system permease subunit
MKKILGLFIILMGIAVGLYVGLWWGIIGGIVAILDHIKGIYDLDSMGIAINLCRIVFGGGLGEVVAWIIACFGFVMIKE